MRGVLVDWLVEVSVEYKPEPYTLHRTIYLIDMFLSKNYIERQKLQLLGIICMLIASRFIRAAQASHQCLASYLAELTLIDYNFLVFVPSNITAAAVFLARWMLDQPGRPWVVFFSSLTGRVMGQNG
ncbi:putative cyclin [Helianthus annuus]|nr:putative cyclin [Helianthus annuus]